MNPITCFETIDVGHPYRLVGQEPQSDATGLIWQPPSYRGTQRGGTPTSSTLRIPGCAVGYFSIHNRSGNAAVLGLGVRIPNYLWRAGQWTDATTTYTDDTTDAQTVDSGTPKFPLETTTNSDGHIIFSRVPFNAISYRIGTASVAGAGYTHAFAFSDPEGDAWTADSNPFVTSFGTAAIAATTTDATEALHVFGPPYPGWGRTTTAGAATLATGAPVGYYGYRIIADNAPDTAAVADSLAIYRLFFLTEAVADNGTMSQDWGAKDFVMAVDPNTGELYGDALVALTSDVTASQNRVTVMVRGR